MEFHITHLKKLNKAAEQYQRRLALRISGIDLPSNGSKEIVDECLEKVKNVLDKIEVDNHETLIDRAHSIGRDKVINGRKAKPMSVRFTAGRHRTKKF